MLRCKSCWPIFVLPMDWLFETDPQYCLWVVALSNSNIVATGMFDELSVVPAWTGLAAVQRMKVNFAGFVSITTISIHLMLSSHCTAVCGSWWHLFIYWSVLAVLGQIPNSVLFWLYWYWCIRCDLFCYMDFRTWCIAISTFPHVWCACSFTV